jgi:hypothetical protein
MIFGSRAPDLFKAIELGGVLARRLVHNGHWVGNVGVRYAPCAAKGVAGWPGKICCLGRIGESEKKEHEIERMDHELRIFSKLDPTVFAHLMQLHV